MTDLVLYNAGALGFKARWEGDKPMGFTGFAILGERHDQLIPLLDFLDLGLFYNDLGIYFFFFFTLCSIIYFS